MANTLNSAEIKRRDIAYYRRRQQNRVFALLAKFFADEAEAGRISKKALADRLGKDPAQITRWLSEPKNFELDTLSDLLLAMDAELDHNIVRFCERVKPNYVHPNALFPIVTESATINVTASKSPDVTLPSSLTAGTALVTAE